MLYVHAHKYKTAQMAKLIYHWAFFLANKWSIEPKKPKNDTNDCFVASKWHQQKNHYCFLLLRMEWRRCLWFNIVDQNIFQPLSLHCLNFYDFFSNANILFKRIISKKNCCWSVNFNWQQTNKSYKVRIN